MEENAGRGKCFVLVQIMIRGATPPTKDWKPFMYERSIMPTEEIETCLIDKGQMLHRSEDSWMFSTAYTTPDDWDR